MRGCFSRSEALLGGAAMARLEAARVLVVGVGGVGSWCAEALVRTGVGKITLVDDDVVAESNVNRQCPATAKTIGRAKVEAVNVRYSSSCVLCLKSFSLIVDAIDSVDCKAELILAATEAGVPLVSSMGAALKTDPTLVKVTRFEKVEGDGLARALRQRFKKLNRFPAAKFSCVWSSEEAFVQAAGAPLPRSAKGSLMPVTATFGMCLASEAIRILTKGENK